MTLTTLVSAAELAAHLADPQWVVFDCRHDLFEPDLGRRAYEQSHIPGARFLHLDEDLSGLKTGTNGRHPLPDPALFCARLTALGMSNDKQAVAYDDAGGPYAARLWWILRWLGHAKVAVLDGGWGAWQRAGLPTTALRPVFIPGAFSGTALQHTVDANFILDHLEQAEIQMVDAHSPERYQIVDARSADRFHGENETLDPVGGHIPGALNRYFKDNLAPDGHFKSAAEIKQEFSVLLGQLAPARVVHQCGSGVSACHNLLAMEIAGLPASRLYPGSWSEWCSDPQRPVER